jgi:2-polyprenyl-3-methyl-5-hydroxy-6-metoxy-1,4-benzoquinol methylase
MSVGVFHHVPDTKKAMIDCVKKVKKAAIFMCAHIKTWMIEGQFSKPCLSLVIL